MRTNFKQDTVLTAIAGSGAVMSHVARVLQCDWHTAHKWVHKWDATRKAWEDEQNKILDLAETVLYRNIRDGESADAKWVLSRRGKHRGWGDAVELTGKDGGPIIVQWDDSDATDDN